MYLTSQHTPDRLPDSRPEIYTRSVGTSNGSALPMLRYPDTDEPPALAEDCERCPALVACHNRISWEVGPQDTSVGVGGSRAGGLPDGGTGQSTREGFLDLVLDRIGCPVRGLIRSFVTLYRHGETNCVYHAPTDRYL